MPILECLVSLYEFPCTNQPVEPFLVVQTSYGNNTFVRYIGIRISKKQGCIRYYFDVRQIPPIASILVSQYYKSVELPDDALVLLGAPTVDKSQQTVSIVLFPRAVTVQ